METVNEKQAAEMVGVSVRTLQAWRQKRRGPNYIKAGAKVVYPVVWLRNYIADQMVLTKIEQAEAA